MINYNVKENNVRRYIRFLAMLPEGLCSALLVSFRGASRMVTELITEDQRLQLTPSNMEQTRINKKPCIKFHLDYKK